MAINQDIHTYLTTQRTNLLELTKSDELASAVREKLERLDVEDIRQQFCQELIANCEEDWTYTTDFMDGILFEYNDFHSRDEDATAYGIVLDIKDSFKVQAEPYGFVGSYDFAQPMEALPCFTLSVFSGFFQLLSGGLLLSEGGEPIHAVNEVAEYYVLTAFLALHDALGDFSQTTSFKKRNCLGTQFANNFSWQRQWTQEN